MVQYIKDPATALAKKFAWLNSALKKVGGEEAPLRLAGHLRAVTQGRHYLLANYHNDKDIPDREKSALYSTVWNTIIADHGRPDWSRLQGQSGGTGRVDPLEITAEIEPVTETVMEPVAEPVVAKSVAQPSLTGPTRATKPATGDAEELADVLGRMLTGRIKGEATVDVQQVEAIADRCARSAVCEALVAADREFAGKLEHHLGNGSFPSERVQAMIDSALGQNVRRVAIALPNGGTREIKGMVHEQFPLLLQMAAARVNLLLTGPSGSGKTHAAEQVAKALALPFYYNGAIDTEYKLKGFIDAGGKLISPAFRKAWQNGGVYCFDEVDASLPPAVLSFNGALSNHLCDFPDGMVERHPDCIILATGNTWLGGATFDYVGRMKQDAAFADRFATLYWGYDEKLERALCGNPDWVKFVQAVRANILRHGLKVIVSPRATFNGEKLLAAGIEREEVIRSCVQKGMAADQWQQVNPDTH